MKATAKVREPRKADARRAVQTASGHRAPTADGYQLEAQIGFLLRKAHQQATETFHAVMTTFDVTPMQFAALAKVHDLGSVSQNQLGRFVAMDPATIFGVVGRLNRRGFVSLRPDAKDARLTLIELTDAGRETVIAMKSLGAEVSARTLAPLNADEAKTLLALIARIG